MQEPSIRSFTLDYYRSLGAELTPLDAEARTWEIRLPERRSVEGYTPLSISFDPLPADSAAASGEVSAMGRTTPQWRAILDACTQARTVAYRHVVAEPVAHIARVFQAKLPSHGVQGAKLVSVTPRTAVGFSHRVTFEAPAMAARHEELHHDLLDAITGERLDALSDAFYSLHSIPIDPPQDPRLLALDTLHSQAISYVDVRTEARGHALETELAARLHEAEARLRRHFEAQIAQILREEETALDAKLEHLAYKTRETKLPGAIAKLQAEAAKVAVEIEQLRVRRDLESERIQDAERARLEAERARHEVTVETALVSVAYVTFDVVHYALELARDGRIGTMEVRYVPVTGELLMPHCPACGLPMTHATPGLMDDGQAICERCTWRLDYPSAQRPDPEPCSRCGVLVPHDAVQRCHLSEVSYCVVCAMACDACGKTTAREKLRPNPSGRGMICPDHAIACTSCHEQVFPKETFTCSACNERHCHSHATPCEACGMPTCIRCARAHQGHCTVCAKLKRVGSRHQLVTVAQGMFPSLKRWGLSWKLAEAGEFALLEWKAPTGRRGRLVLAVQDYYMVSHREKGAFERHWR